MYLADQKVSDIIMLVKLGRGRDSINYTGEMTSYGCVEYTLKGDFVWMAEAATVYLCKIQPFNKIGDSGIRSPNCPL